MTRKWNLPLTYQPKIEPVKQGICTQTIRTGRKFNEGDLVRFYIWTGKPYRSTRETITGYMPLWYVDDVLIIQTGMLHYHNEKFYKETHWNGFDLDRIAAIDFVVPPTGKALRDVLVQKNGKIPAEGIKAQIIRWKP